MKMQHTPYHWVAVALALAVLLLTLSDAHGQSTGAGAMFEGRPAMAGAQGGQGAQAGMPQGGIGVQGNELAERGLRRNPSDLDEFRQARREAREGVDVAGVNSATDKTVRKDVAPARDQGIAKDQRSATSKAKRAAKRTITRSRHGNSEIDTAKAGS